MDANVNALKLLGFGEEIYENLKKIIELSDGEWKTSVAKEVCKNNQKSLDLTKELYNILYHGDPADTLDQVVIRLQNKRFQQNDYPENDVRRLGNHYNRLYKNYGIGREPVTNTEFYKLPSKLKQDKLPDGAMIRKLDGTLSMYNWHRMDNPNQPQYLDREKMFYSISKKGIQNCEIITKRVPWNAKKDELESEKCKVSKTEKPDEVKLTIKNQYVGIKNKWFIAVSTKRPEFKDADVESNGEYALVKLYTMVTGGGTCIYLFARQTSSIKVNSKIGNHEKSGTILAYGYDNNELELRMKEYLRYFLNNDYLFEVNVGDKKEIKHYLEERNILLNENPKLDEKQIKNELAKKYNINWAFNFARFNVKIYFETITNNQFEEKVNWFGELED